jgi:predicted O-methyltransferase YrrM
MKRRLVIATAVAVAIGVAVSLAVGWWQVAVALLAAVQAGVLVLLVDIRRRMARSTEVKKAMRALVQAERRIDNIGTRMLAAVEMARTENDDVWTELRSHISALRSAVETDSERERSSSRQIWAGSERTRQVEAMLQLFARIKPRAGMPSSGGWAMDATNILNLLDVVERTHPELIVELGGGTSSVWLGYVLEILGSGRLVSIDQDPHYAGLTRAQVHRHGLERLVEVRIASLVESPIPGHETKWYDPAVFDDLEDIDLLLVDGPTKATGPMSRYPALPVLEKRLSSRAVVVLDDAHRPDEKELVKRWRAESPTLSKIDGIADDHIAILARAGVFE